MNDPHIAGRDVAAPAEPAPALLDLAPEDGGRDRLAGAAYWVALLLGSIGIALTINQTFNLNLFGGPIIDTSFFYVMLGLFLSLAFLAYPRAQGRQGGDPLV